MAGKNGTAGVADTRPMVGALDLEDCAYERVPIRVKINGEFKVFEGWVSGPGCPGRVMVEFARVFQRYQESTDSDAVALPELLTEGLRVALETDYMTADLLAAGGRGHRILQHLGFLTKPTELGATPDPEGMGEAAPSTSAPTSQPLSDATAASAPTAAAG